MTRVVVAQIGARMHYAVPRIMAAEGHLARFYTDIVATRGWPRLLRHVPARLQPAALRRLAGRLPHGIPDDRMTCFAGFGLSYALTRMRARGPAERTAAELRAGETFGRLVADHGFDGASTIYAMGGEALEQLAAARDRGLGTVVEQLIAPAPVLRRLMAEEHDRHPDWEPPPEANPLAGDWEARERAEWAVADLIVCGSDFVREGVIAAGGDGGKCVVVPYGVDARFRFGPRPRRDGPLRVLTIGAVGLRKGTPTVLAAARRLKGRAVFRLIGPGDILPEARARLAADVDLRGAVPRADILEHYRWADVFLLPSVCEGSATVVYEALAAGLPVVTTPNTGTVVRDRLDGFVVPIRDPDAVVEALERLHADRDLRAAMAINAGRRAADFDLSAYGRRLCAALGLGPRTGARSGARKAGADA